MKKKILFVCTGNTCRSSMAKALAEKIIFDLVVSDEIKVDSAGTAVIPGMGAAKNAIDALADKNINLNNHKAKQLTIEMIEEADLILTMTRNHKRQILNMLPESREKVYTLKEYLAYESQAESDNSGKKLTLLASKLEEKERDFYSKHGKKLEELKKNEKEIQNWYRKLYEYTDKERKELKLMEEKLRNIDIQDPIGQPLEVYKKCSDELEKLITRVIKILTK